MGQNSTRERNKSKYPSPQQTGKGFGSVTLLRGSGFHLKEEFLSLPQGQAQALVCPDTSRALGLSRSPCVDVSDLGLRCELVRSCWDQALHRGFVFLAGFASFVHLTCSCLCTHSIGQS